jgi:hypothetical protein
MKKSTGPKVKADAKANLKAKIPAVKVGAKAAERNADDRAKAGAGAVRDKRLDQMNAEYQVVLDAGRVRVMSFDRVSQTVGRGANIRMVASFMSFADFANFHSHQSVTLDTGKDMQLGLWWLHNPNRLTYTGIVFKPGESKSVGTKLNLWRGWGVQPAPGTWHLLRDHIQLVMCNGNAEMFEYAINWLAWTVQHPAERAEVALVFRGGKGSGKGVLGNVMLKMFGQHGVHISNAKHLTGFNNHLRDACFLFADEAYWPGDKKAEGDLKRLVTEDTLFIEGKGRDAISWPNMLHILMASNEDWIVPASERERRYVLNEVNDSHIQDATWFDPMFRQLEDGGAAAMLHDLLAYKLPDNWHPRKIPANAGLLDQQMRSLSPFDTWFLELLETGQLAGCDPRRPNEARSGDFEEVITSGDHDRHVKRIGLYSQARQIDPRLRSHTSEHALGIYLRKQGCTNETRVCRRTGWTFPALMKCRAAWELRFPGTVWRNNEITAWQCEDEDLNQSAAARLRVAHLINDAEIEQLEKDVKAEDEAARVAARPAKTGTMF